MIFVKKSWKVEKEFKIILKTNLKMKFYANV